MNKPFIFLGNGKVLHQTPRPTLREARKNSPNAPASTKLLLILSLRRIYQHDSTSPHSAPAQLQSNTSKILLNIFSKYPILVPKGRKSGPLSDTVCRGEVESGRSPYPYMAERSSSCLKLIA